MDKRLLGELGTMVLILVGNTVVANVLLKKAKGEASGWMVIATGWGLAVMCGVFTAVACGSADANLNPAVTLASAIGTGNFSKLLPYALAQTLGAIAGSLLVWIHYFPHWAATPDADLKRGCFCTSPAIRKPAANLASEVIATFVLILVASAIASKAGAPTGPAPD